MHKHKNYWISLCVICLLLGAAFSAPSLALAKGNESVARSRGTNAELEAALQDLASMVLQEADSATGPWTTVFGSLDYGFTMVLSGTAGTMEYLDVASLTPMPAAGDYPFYLDPARVPANFWTWWAAQGVVAGATGQQGLMWGIINGTSPMFYVRVASGEADLIDGFRYLVDGSGTTARLKVNGDYPVHTYNYEGVIEGENLVVGITFTHDVVPSLRIDDAEVDEITIDGCEFVDVTIHLENVVNLYAVDVSLQFDPAKVEVVDLDTSQTGVNLQPITETGFFDAGYWVYNQANNTTGAIRYTATQLRNSPEVSGEGNIARLRLRTKTLGSSQISITAMTLSDRDGYLVGVPLQTAINFPLTTQFSVAGGLDLDISRVNSDTVKLEWPAAMTDEVSSFVLHRSSTPYFTAASGTVYQTITNTGSAASYSFNDDDNLAGAVNHNFYALQVVCTSGLTSPASWQVGKFETRLYETLRTDYSWIGIVLELEGVTDTLELAAHIQANSSSALGVLGVRIWNSSSQQLELFINDPDEDQALVSIKQPYQIETNISGSSNGNVIWDQVGRLPAITSDTYTLRETSRTDYAWVLQPLDMTGISDTDTLIAHIEANASGSVVVKSVSVWNGPAQNFDLFFPEDEGLTYFGLPIRIEVDITGTLPVTWP